MSELSSPGSLGGQVLSIEEITERVPSYPDGRRPRPRAVARRLRPVLELVERGPNGSRGKGATYRILTPRTEEPSEDAVVADLDWLEAAARRMTKEK